MNTFQDMPIWRQRKRNKSRSSNKSSGHSKKGIGAVEVAISAGLMIIIVALAVDVTILNYAFTVNDAAARDAARAAAACNYATAATAPTGDTYATQAAAAACATHKTDGVLISQPALLSTTAPDFQYNDLSFTPTPPQTSNVVVTTFVDVALPIPLNFWGNNFTNLLSSNGGKIRFIRTYAFPIVHEYYAQGS
jgi:Flp pilus assembly protein TadG